MVKPLITRALSCALAMTVLFSSGAAVAQSASAEDTYLQAVQEQTAIFDESLEIFDGYMVRLEEGPNESESYMLVEGMVQEAEIWRDVAEAAADLDVPATCSESETPLQDWASDVDLLADGWDGLYNGTRGAEQTFDAQRQSLEESRAELDVSLVGCYELSSLEQPARDATPSATTEVATGTGDSGVAGLRDIVSVKRDTGTPAETPESGTDVGAESGTYTLPASGMVVTFPPELLFEDPAGTDVPDQLVLNPGSGIAAVAVMEGTGNAREVRDSYVDGFATSQEELESVVLDGNSRVATGIYHVVTNDVDYVMFIRVDTQSVDGYSIIEVIVAEPDSLVDEVQLLQDEVAIDGVPMLQGVDSASVLDEYKWLFP